jgi:hypothetical protein
MDLLIRSGSSFWATLTLVGSVAWTFTITSCGVLGPFGIVAQPIQKIPITAMSIKRLNMAKPPQISIQFRVTMLKARFIPKSNAGRIEIYLCNIK